MRTQIVIVARPSLELELALDSLDDLRDEVLLFSQPSDAAAILLSPSGRPPASPIGVVLVEVGSASSAIQDFVTELRSTPATGSIPIVLYGTEEACRELDLENGFRPSSCVYAVSDSRATATALAQTIHYWGVVNRPPAPPRIQRDAGGPA